MSDVRSYYSVETNGAAVWLENGGIAFLNNKSGTSQVWKTDMNGKTPEQLTQGTERVWRLIGTPGGKAVLYASDMGGNEQEQLYLLRMDGSAPQALTTDPKVRNYVGGMTPDGRYIYYSGNKRSPANFDIMKLDLTTCVETTVLENQDNYNIPCAVSPDGEYMLYNKLRGESDNKMWIIDMTTGKAKDVDPAGTYAQYGSPAWKMLVGNDGMLQEFG